MTTAGVVACWGARRKGRGNTLSEISADFPATLVDSAGVGTFELTEVSRATSGDLLTATARRMRLLPVASVVVDETVPPLLRRHGAY